MLTLNTEIFLTFNILPPLIKMKLRINLYIIPSCQKIRKIDDEKNKNKFLDHQIN